MKTNPRSTADLRVCHWHECEEVDQMLKDLKVTIRCVPLDAEPAPGTCLFTGQPSPRRAVFAKAY